MTQARETIAVYAEQIIQTYGFRVETDLTMVVLSPMAAALDIEQALHEAGVTAQRLRLVTARGQPSGALLLQLVLETAPETPGDASSPDADGVSTVAPPSAAARVPGADPQHRTRVLAPVELVSFQGPHFGDRYGIATRALEALQEAGIELLAMSCAGASIQLVLEQGQGQLAVDHLRGSFSDPRARHRARDGAESP